MRQLSYQELCFVAGGEGDKPTVVDEIVVTASKKEEQDRDGGWYLNFGLGLGLGFNLHIDSGGVDLSVGTGVWGTLEVGHASDGDAMKDKAEIDKAFVEGKVGTLPGVGEVGGAIEYVPNTGDVKLTAGPISLSTDNQAEGSAKGVTVNLDGTVSFGVDSGFGEMWYVGHRDWDPPAAFQP